jgi:hypothetical protein
MAGASDPVALTGELSSLGSLDALREHVRALAIAAAGRADGKVFREPSSVEGLARAGADTRAGNAVEILERGVRNPEEALLVSVLLALGIARDFPSAPETEITRAKQLAFIAAHGPINALLAADPILGDERRRPLWRAVATFAEPSTAEDTPTSLAALAALAAARSEAARAAARDLAERSTDPLVRALLGRESASATTSGLRLSGELGPAPHGPVATTFLALSGLLFLTRSARLLGQVGLAFQQPAEVRVSERGLEIRHETRLLGRVLRARETLVPLGNVARVTREVRYARLGLYLGLLALAFGSYVGMGLLVDGTRVPGGSVSLLGTGLVVILLGLVLDYALTTLADNVRGRCRLVIVPRKGKSFAVGALDPARADTMVAALAARIQV